MNSFPEIKSYKYSKFSNPLSGRLYDNKKYSESFHHQAQQTNFDSKITDRLKKNSTEFQIQNSKVLAVRNYQRILSLRNNFSVEEKTSRSMNITKRLYSNDMSKCSRNKKNNINSISRNEVDSKSQQKKGLSRQLSTLKAGTKFQDPASEILVHKFKDVQILVLDSLKNYDDIQTNILKLNFTKYFQLFFNRQLSGITTTALLQSTQEYIENMSINNTIDELLEIQDFPVDLFNLVNKNGVVNKIKELEGTRQIKQIEAVVKYYCVPSRYIRQTILKDIILSLTIQAYQTFNCSKDNQYILLNQYGTQIQDFIQIKFDCQKLYLTQKVNSHRVFKFYINLLENNSRIKGKYSFRENLKLNFRKLVDGNCDEIQNSLSKDQIQQKKINIKKAQQILNSKNQNFYSSRQKFKQYLDKKHEEKHKSKPNSLSFNSRTSTYSTLDFKITQQFDTLRQQNQYIDSQYKSNPESAHSVQIQIILSKCIYFKNKTDLQVKRILVAVDFIEEKQQINSIKKKLINFDQYQRLRKIINCLGPKENIVRFIDQYLRFDEYGELKRQNLKGMLQQIVNKDKKSAVVIEQIIWSWFQKNSIVSNTAIRRDQLFMHYQKNKIIYYLLISLIFGTNQTSALEIVQEILF